MLPRQPTYGTPSQNNQGFNETLQYCIALQVTALNERLYYERATYAYITSTVINDVEYLNRQYPDVEPQPAP